MTDTPKVVFAHGCWDGLHIGHIRHLEAAKALGDKLVVGVTADAHVGKGPGRPRYGEFDRGSAVKALACVDEIWLVDAPDPSAQIAQLRPAIYAKGKEYEGRDCPDFRAAREVGCEVVFIGETLGSSSAALNADATLDPFLASCRETYKARDVDEAFSAMATVFVTVIGDAIIDEYVPAELQGLTSKGGAPSLRVTGPTEFFDGGTLALANHAAALANTVRERPSVVATRKRRYYSLAGGQMRTLAAVETIAEAPPAVVGFVEGELVLVGDYGHGFVTDGLLEAINVHGQCAVTCQTNSANYGLNVLTQRYANVGLFVVDDREMKLARHTASPTLHDLTALEAELGAGRAYWTRGERSTLDAFGHDCPALESRPIDPLGAGDAFFVVASLCWAAHVPAALSLLLAQIAGAQMTRVLGNARALDKDAMIRTAKAILA